MHVLIGKKQIVIAVLVVALALAVFVNWYYTDGTRLFPGGAAEKAGETLPDGAAQYVNGHSDEEYFATVRMNRDSARGEALEELQAVLAQAAEDSDAAVSTAQSIERMSAEVKMESDIESLVAGRIGAGCVAVISDNSVDVVVTKTALNDGNVLAISDVVQQVCGDAYENVRVSAAA
ncbi:MAG: SpoIIIAH-like family protein [Clostridia bacterium]|nr:SpoIIIAH-like family protein [Clostridia bacterium]